jgi:hypothetical protein
MSDIPYIVDDSCAGHPLLRRGTIPRSGFLKMNPRKVFSLGSLVLQDASVNRRTLKETNRLWSNLHALYGVYLTFSRSQIVASAAGEQLTKVSEIVGIACGLAALESEFEVPRNRITRYLGGGVGRRMDFEFYVDGRRYFHETKGTTYAAKLNSLRHEIVRQAVDTAKTCSSRGNGPKLAGTTGSVTLIRQSSRQQFNTSVLLVDPPASPGHPASERLELAAVLRHYAGVLAVTHMRSATNDPPDGLDWISNIVSVLESGKSPPTAAPKRLLLRGRLTEKYKSEEFGGSYFDMRATEIAATHFSTFEDATAALSDPVSFVGVTKLVTDLIQRNRCTTPILAKTRGHLAEAVDA